MDVNRSIEHDFYLCRIFYGVVPKHASDVIVEELKDLMTGDANRDFVSDDLRIVGFAVIRRSIIDSG
jgi:hypothetical protein